MKLKTLISSLSFTVALQAAPLYIGTNTGGGSASKGIYLADFDSTSGKLTVPTLAVEYKNPGFLALHPTKPLLYACGRPNVPFADGSDSVAVFAIEKDHGLNFLGEASVGGKGACHVAVDMSGRTVAVANYGDGSFSTIRLNEDGVPGAIASLIRLAGSGPNPSRQKEPHAHGVYFDQSNTHLFMPDLGQDQVFIYPFDATTSKLGEPLASLKSAPGSGPRHLAFSPDEKNAYVIEELTSTVLSTRYAAGKFEVMGTLPTLPADFKGNSTTAEIEVHPNGKYVYASNRGHDSIAVYQRDIQTGELKFLQHAPCGGKTPRHFKIDPTGKWLLCAHQDSNTISVLAIGENTGLLGEPSAPVSSPSPICLLFPR